MIEAGGKKKILVVDDEEDVRDIMEAVLTGEGFDVDTATNGLEALEKYKESLKKGDPFDVIITDLMMPVMDGINLIEEIQKLETQPLIIVITGFGTIDTAVKALKIGAYDYILKPFKIGDILLTIKRGLESERLKRENILLKELINIHRMVEDIGSTLELRKIEEVFKAHSFQLTKADAIVLVRNKDIAVYPEDKELEGIIRNKIGDISRFERIGEEEIKKSLPELYEMGIRSAFTKAFYSGDDKGGFIVVFFKTTPNWDYIDSSMGILLNRFEASLRNARLYEKIRENYIRTIISFARAIEAKDPYTRGHSERVAKFSVSLGKRLGLSAKELETLNIGGILHDIGKIGVDDRLLKKSSSLTHEEFEKVKEHPVIGRKILEPVEYFKDAIPIVYHHHERFDGKGYPEGLKGSKIPFLARVIAVVDAYEAMTSDRAYRKAFSKERALEEIEANKGTQFDPDIAEEFLKMMEDED